MELSKLCGRLDGKGLGGEWIYMCVWLSPFVVYLKLSQHCLLIAIPQYKIKSSKKKKGVVTKKMAERELPLLWGVSLA